MFDQELKLYDLVLAYCKRSAADIDEAKLTTQPAPAMNPPLWILGHLAVATDYALMNLGGKPQCPKEWHKAFGMGSRPVSELSPTPTKAQLLAAIETGHERVKEAVKMASAEALDRPHSVKFPFESPVRSVRDLVAHLMTTHPMFHIGQLSYWRRQMGHAPLF